MGPVGEHGDSVFASLGQPRVTSGMARNVADSAPSCDRAVHHEQPPTKVGSSGSLGGFRASHSPSSRGACRFAPGAWMVGASFSPNPHRCRIRIVDHCNRASDDRHLAGGSADRGARHRFRARTGSNCRRATIGLFDVDSVSWVNRNFRWNSDGCPQTNQRL